MTFTNDELAIITDALGIAAADYDRRAEKAAADYRESPFAARLDARSRACRKLSYEIANRPAPSAKEA